ncbi:MAG: glycosyltransferase family 39 protein [bacterium]|jgi:hypothetical protein|nr:glycosyltransferase family 39 protein [bacterium]
MAKPFVFLLVLAFAIRFAWVFLLAPATSYGSYHFIDGDGYQTFAAAFDSGEFLRSPQYVLRVPLYPALLAIFSRLPLPFHDVIHFWQILLDCLTLSCICLFAKKFFGNRTAILAGLLFALYPLAVYRLVMLNTEIVQSAILAFWGLSAALFLERPHPRQAVYLSLLTAMLLYINPAMQFIPLFFSAFLLYRDRASSPRLLAAFLIPLALICLAWGLRNQNVTGEFYLFDVRGGKEFWLGNNQKYQGRWEGPHKEQWMAELDGYHAEVMASGGSDNQFNSIMFQKGLANILENPLGALALNGKKFLRFWYVPASETLLPVTIPLQSFFLLFAGLGIYALGIRHSGTVLPLFLITYTCLIYTLSYACIRFSHPIMPWMCILAAAGIQYSLEQGKLRWKQQKENG